MKGAPRHPEEIASERRAQEEQLALLRAIDAKLGRMIELIEDPRNVEPGPDEVPEEPASSLTYLDGTPRPG